MESGVVLHLGPELDLEYWIGPWLLARSDFWTSRNTRYLYFNRETRRGRLLGFFPLPLVRIQRGKTEKRGGRGRRHTAV